MWYGMVDIARTALLPRQFRSPGLASRVADAARPEGGSASMPAEELRVSLRASEFWALRDVSFTLRRGECMGVMGHNGAGKSTLFSVLSGIYGPTEGRVTVRGRLQALIALGAGFHPALTGRENIYINASIFGLNGREIDAIFEEVVDFSELGDFIDMPVKNYSSGMFVRLGFSVAIHLKPDVLLIDEVLSVGDLAFQNKSFARVKKLIDAGTPVLFVSHYPQAVESVCNRALWLERGRVRMMGGVPEVVGAYVESMVRHRASGPEADPSLQPIRITRVELLGDGVLAPERVISGRPVTVRLHYVCDRAIDAPYFAFSWHRPGAASWEIARCSMADDAIVYPIASGFGAVDCLVETSGLMPGPYVLRCGIIRSQTRTTGQSEYQEFFEGASLWVEGTPQGIGRPGLLRGTMHEQPPYLIPHQWKPPVRAEASP